MFSSSFAFILLFYYINTCKALWTVLFLNWYVLYKYTSFLPYFFVLLDFLSCHLPCFLACDLVPSCPSALSSFLFCIYLLISVLDFSLHPSLSPNINPCFLPPCPQRQIAPFFYSDMLGLNNNDKRPLISTWKPCHTILITRFNENTSLSNRSVQSFFLSHIRFSLTCVIFMFFWGNYVGGCSCMMWHLSRQTEDTAAYLHGVSSAVGEA